MIIILSPKRQLKEMTFRLIVYAIIRNVASSIFSVIRQKQQQLRNIIDKYLPVIINTLCKSWHVVHLSIVDISYTVCFWQTKQQRKKIVSREIIVTSNGLSKYTFCQIRSNQFQYWIKQERKKIEILNCRCLIVNRDADQNQTVMLIYSWQTKWNCQFCHATSRGNRINFVRFVKTAITTTKIMWFSASDRFYFIIWAIYSRVNSHKSLKQNKTK